MDTFHFQERKNGNSTTAKFSTAWEDFRIASFVPSQPAMKKAARKGAPSTPVAFSATSMAGIRYFRMLQSSLIEPTSEDTAGADGDKEEEHGNRNRSTPGGILAHRHFGLQAQEPDAVLLSIFNRCAVKLSRTALSELYLRKTDTVVRAWGQRCTLHMYAVSDWCAAMAATRGRLISATTSSLTRRGSDDAEEICEKVSDIVKKLLMDGKEVDTSIVNKIADEHNVDSGTRMQLRRYPFLHATESGLGSRVSRDGKRSRLVVIAPRSDTCPWDEDITVHDATVIAARRYFATYAPAQEEDFRYWMGLPAAQSRSAVKTLVDSGDLVSLRVDDERTDHSDHSDYLIMKESADKLKNEKEEVPAREAWPVKLLGRFDPYLLPHRKKTDIIAEKERKRIWQSFAQIIPTVIVHGRIRGTWKLTRSGKAATVVITLFDDNNGNNNNDNNEERVTEREKKMCVEAAKEIATVFWEMETCSVEIVDEAEDETRGKREKRETRETRGKRGTKRRHEADKKTKK